MANILAVDANNIKKFVSEKLEIAKNKRDKEEKDRQKIREEKEQKRKEREEYKTYFVGTIRTYLIELADMKLGECEAATWLISEEEEDTGENYFELYKTLKGEIYIKIFSPEMGLPNMPIRVGEISTMPLAMTVYNRLKWIYDKQIEPVITPL